MNEIEFNLVDETWIRVMAGDCSIKELSLKDTLTEAHNFKGLAGEMEPQNVALLRLLIAIVHTVFSRVDTEGNNSPAEDEKTALERWNQLMRRGCFPRKPVLDYLETWHDRFWLFHPKRPFNQAASANNGTENTAAKLNGEVSESNNKARLFSFLTGKGKQGMSFAESARWLLFLNGFDDCAAKQRDKSSGSRSMTVAWLGKLGIVYAVGSSLFETIMLNMPMLVNGEKIWDEDDKPNWEEEDPCEEERRTIEMPQDLASLMTLQSRRLLLIRNNDMVTGYKVLGGDAFSEQNALNEPMTLWRYREDNKTQISYYQPMRHERNRQIWREFGAIVNTGNNQQRPGIVSWCSRLQRDGFFPKEKLITFRIVSVRYDSSQSSSITDAFSDVLSFHANLLVDAGQEWIREINHQIDLVEKAATEIGGLQVNLGKACGQKEDSLWDSASSAKEQYYLGIDAPFREWLLGLDPDQDADAREQLITQWQSVSRMTALSIGRQLVIEKGDAAYIGRKVNENKKVRHYSSPEAFRWFKYHINSIYPYAEEGKDQDE